MRELMNLLQDDLERIFADWGEPATLLEIIRDYELETGQMVETRHGSEIQVIRGEDRPQLIGNISATLSLTRRLVLIRSRDLPNHIPLETARLAFAETTYEIRSIRESNQAGMMVLECIQSGLSA